MQAPATSGFNAENFPSAPDWFVKFLSSMSRFCNDTSTALTNRITLADNLSAQVVKTTFTAHLDANNNYTLPIQNKLGSVPTSVLVGQLLSTTSGSPQKQAWSFTWQMDGNNNISLLFQGLQANNKYQVTVIAEA